jgi:hypothetical protein
MPSSDLSPQEFSDLLHKLLTESTKLQALFSCSAGGVRAIVRGVLRIAPDNTLWVVEPDRNTSGPMLTFDPSLAVVRKYGDERSMEGRPEFIFGLHFSSALSFVFADGSSFVLLEINEE